MLGWTVPYHGSVRSCVKTMCSSMTMHTASLEDSGSLLSAFCHCSMSREKSGAPCRRAWTCLRTSLSHYECPCDPRASSSLCCALLAIPKPTQIAKCGEDGRAKHPKLASSHRAKGMQPLQPWKESLKAFYPPTPSNDNPAPSTCVCDVERVCACMRLHVRVYHSYSCGTM